MEKRLIINADDFGFSSGVNEGIIKGHTNGVLTSATIMANMPAAEEAVELAKQNPTLGVGVHLNLTDGIPLTRNETIAFLLNEKGNFTLKPAKLAIMLLFSRELRAAAETELAAQIQWVIDRGIKPTHLDSHKHIHAYPLLFPIVCSLAMRFGISAMRYAFEPKYVGFFPWPATDRKSRKRALIVRLMARSNRRRNPSFFKTDALLGVAHTGNINIDFFKSVSLYNTCAVAEVMTHPGYSYDLDRSVTRLVKQREIELEALCSEITKEYFKLAGIKLVHYGQL